MTRHGFEFRSWLAIAVAALMAAACGKSPPKSDDDPAVTSAPITPDPEHVAAVEAWRKQRIERLTSETGWLTLVGLHWLEQGDNTVGSRDGAAVQLPASVPAAVGVIKREGDTLTFQSADGVDIRHDDKPAGTLPLASDANGKPTTLHIGSVMFYVIKRGDRYGVRAKDRDAKVRKTFKGITHFPIDKAWRKTAAFERYPQPKMLRIQDVAGIVTDQPSPGAVVFDHEGQTLRLDVTGDPADGLFIVFKDRTAGKLTYGAGRFLYTEPPRDGQVEVDFNRAYNPPCAFTPYATCPLPPKQNKLAVHIQAGEKNYH